MQTTIDVAGCFGKYSNTADEYFHGLTLDGCCDEETGDVESFGWYGLVMLDDGPIVINWEGGSQTVYGAIVHEDSQGFVDVTYYDCAAEASAQFAMIEDEYAELCGNE